MKADNELESKRKELQRRLADLQARLPAHSIPPSMMMEWDELEEQLDLIRVESDKKE